MSNLIPFPDRAASQTHQAGQGVILIDRTQESFTVELCQQPLAAGVVRTFTHAGDALDYAEALAEQTGIGFCIMCDL